MWNILCIYLFCIIVVHSVAPPNICTSDICVKEAARIKKSLNLSVDPCDNFHEFVCGKHIDEPSLSEDKTSDWTLSTAQDKILKRLQLILSEKQQPNEPKAIKLAKTFHQSCMNMDARNKKGVQPLMDILERYGGWPVIKGDNWKSDGWDWLEMSKNMSNDGLLANFIFNVKISDDIANSTNNIIQIERASFSVDEGLLKKNIFDVEVQRHLKHMVYCVGTCGGVSAEEAGITSEARAKREMLQVFEFEKSLARIPSRWNIYKKHTVQELDTIYPHINWTDFLNWNLHNIHHVDKNETVALADVDNIVDHIKNIMEQTSKRTIANYLAWRFVSMNSDYLNSDLRGDLYGADPLPVQCVEEIKKLLPIATEALYIRRLPDKIPQDMGINITKGIHNQFIETLNRATWMDIDSREASIEKAKAMIFDFGYPDELTNDTLINEYYTDLDFQETDSLLHIVLRIQRFSKNHEILKLQWPAKKYDWTDFEMTDVRNQYFQNGNRLHVTTSFLQSLKADGPAYMNYGPSSFALGNRIPTVLDNDGRTTDKNGIFGEWWKRSTVRTYIARGKCFIKQYSSYLRSRLSVTAPRFVNTFEDHINDNIGVDITYAAYQAYVKKNGPELTLPQLEYTPNQLFWIYAARHMCFVYRPKLYVSDYEHDIPREYRVNGPLMNSERFSDDFNCRTFSMMNLANKCKLW